MECLNSPPPLDPCNGNRTRTRLSAKMTTAILHSKLALNYRGQTCFLLTLLIFFSEVHVVRLEHLIIQKGDFAGAHLFLTSGEPQRDHPLSELEGRIPWCKLPCGCAGPGRRMKYCSSTLLLTSSNYFQACSRQFFSTLVEVVGKALFQLSCHIITTTW